MWAWTASRTHGWGFALGWLRIPSTVWLSFHGLWPRRSRLLSPSAPQAPSPYFSSYHWSTSALAVGYLGDGTMVASLMPGQPMHLTWPVAMGALGLGSAKVA